MTTHTHITAELPDTPLRSRRIHGGQLDKNPLTAHARQVAQLRSNRPVIQGWIAHLVLDDDTSLFDAIAGDNTAATSLLVTEHQRGCALATTILIGAKARMLGAIERYAPGDADERIQIVLEAFLSRALARVKPEHPYLDQQLYWITLRTVCNIKEPRLFNAPLPDSAAAIATEDLTADADTYLTGRALLDWAQQRELLSEVDLTALELRFTGATPIPVREVARRLGVSEDGMESRLRRAIARLRAAVAEDPEDLRLSCVAAWFSDNQGGQTGQVGVAA